MQTYRRARLSWTNMNDEWSIGSDDVQRLELAFREELVTGTKVAFPSISTA